MDAKPGGDASYCARVFFQRHLRAAEDHEALFNVIGRDFYVRLPCYSRAFPGKDLGGTEFRLRKRPLAVDFDTVTTIESPRWNAFDAELTAAWQGFMEASLDHRTKATDPHAYRERIQDHVLSIAYYW
ncbi:hypothetical protein CLOP_g9350 [Closterium sp. NIES-67]|nr:hypothetical protein CLOP_g9350 [Closterium sp. NIES-67]